MELLLQRFSTGDESTLGLLYEGDWVNPDPKLVPHLEYNDFQCFTMEDQPNEPKIPGETRIPKGRYKIELRTEGGMQARYAERFDWHKGMLWLRDVPDFTYVYIHLGNDDDDTDGCILVGDGAISNVMERGMVTRSEVAYTRLYEQILDSIAEVWITIEDFD